MLLNGNGISLKLFWILFHSIHEIAFILALFFCWKIDPVRNWLLILFIIHIAVRSWTLIFFAPHIIDFQRMAETSIIPEDLSSRTSVWQTLNYVRVAIFIAVSIGLIPLCIKVLNLKS